MTPPGNTQPAAVPVFADLVDVAFPGRALHLAIGMFDGVHLGHRAVIGAAVQAARQRGGVAAVLTFWPHPSELFRPDAPTRLIQDPEQKIRVLSTLGVDAVVSQHFTPEFAQLPAAEFVAWLKRRRPELATVYVGENFRFGRARAGDVALLVQTAREAGVSVFSAPRVNFDGQPISSTRIRALLESGEMDAAAALLGYPYHSAGVVMPGKRLGRTLGFPTLNLTWAPALRPRLGVYAVRIAGSKSPEPLPAVANYGLRPTVEATNVPRLEVHVLGDCPFDAGDDVVVEWVKFFRPEMKFANLDALRSQIAADREMARRHFAG